MGDEQKRKLSPLSPVRSVGRGLSFTARQVSRVVRNPFARQDSAVFASTAAETQSGLEEGAKPLANFRLWNPFKKVEPAPLLSAAFLASFAANELPGSRLIARTYSA
ncbi:hypothetical protein WJX74_008576 [Apatococcus lobatus]|uniref:Uncharacterized protein n=1 Tax=Apatococcus lobatus TaxID=904363 RepID=A0AAW1Q1R0_9CHLO